PLSTSARLPSVAPAASKSESAMDAPAPASRSIATSAPSALNFLTVSGVAAHRGSPAASFRTAIFIPLFQDQQNDETDDQAREGDPFEHHGEPRVIGDMVRHFLRRRTDQDWLFFGHSTSPLSRSKRGGVHNKAAAGTQALPGKPLKLAFTALK